MRAKWPKWFVANCLPASRGPLKAAGNEPGVVDEKVKRTTPLLNELGDRRQIRQVEADAGANRPRQLFDLAGDSVAGVRVTDSQRHLGTGRCQHVSRLKSEA